MPIRWQDEIAELGQALNRMSLELAEKERLEQHVKQSSQRLRAQAERLALLNALAGAISQTLDLRQVLQIALYEVVHLLGLRGGWIHLCSDGSGPDSIVSFGLEQEVAGKAHVHCAWHQALRSNMLAATASQSSPTLPCPAAIGTLAYNARCISLNHAGSESLESTICIPIEFKGEILGIMTLVGDADSPLAAQVDDSDDLFVAIGRQLGLAVENAQLYEQLCAKEALQKRLLERLIVVQEQERQRIARELHDQTSQSLASLIVTLKVLAQASSLEQVREQVKQLQDTVADVLTEVHDISTRLRPQALDDLGLVPALRQYVKDFRDRFQLVVDLQVVGFGDQRLDPEAETSLYRIAQEALTNVAIHAQAGAVSVLLGNRGHSVVLIVEDDGVGFDVDRVMGRGPPSKALGLYGMEERAALVGGTLTVESAPGKGTTLYVVLPTER